MVLAVMRAYRDREITTKQTREILQAIARFHFIVGAVVGQSSSGGISAMYASHARQLSESKTPQSRANAIRQLKGKLQDPARKPPLDVFEAAFSELRFSSTHTKQARLVKYILREIDRAQVKGLVLDYSEMTIEHIAPENPVGTCAVTPDEVAMLGNLTLVTKKLNGQLANLTFDKKVPILRGAKSWIDPTILRASRWGGPEIRNRTSELAKLAYNKVWKL